MAGERSGRFRRERDDDEAITYDQEMQDDDHGASECAVFVTDIARGVTDDMLKEKFKEFGNVAEAFVVKNKYTGDTKGYGFVHFTTMDEVYAVLDAKDLPRFEDSVNHKVQMVKVTMADPKDTLFITNIPRGWEESDLLKSLTEVGPEAPRKLRYSTSKGTAYASYVDHEQALRCLKNIQRPPSGSPVPPFNAYLAPPRFFDAKNSPSMKVLFVRGISGISQESLRKLFGGHDIVERVVVPMDSARGGPIGHAFVHFHSTKAAAEAKEKLHNYDYNGTRITVEWCLPKSVTHKRATPAPPLAAAYPPYPYPYPPYPYPYPPELEHFYPPPPYPYPPYDPYGHHSPHHDPRESSHRDHKRSSSSDPYHPYSRSQYPPPLPPRYPLPAYPPPHYPSSPSSHSHSSHSPHSSHSSSRAPYERSGSSSRSSSGYPPSSSSPYSSHSSYSSSHSSYASSHPPSYSSRGSRYVPY